MEAKIKNPLLSNALLPAFEQIEAEHVYPAVQELVRASRAVVKEIVADPAARKQVRESRPSLFQKVPSMAVGRRR